MIVKHGCGTQHDVSLCDDGTMDTVIDVDGHEIRFGEAERDKYGVVKDTWLRESAIEACNDGLLSDEN